MDNHEQLETHMDNLTHTLMIRTYMDNTRAAIDRVQIIDNDGTQIYTKPRECSDDFCWLTD